MEIWWNTKEPTLIVKRFNKNKFTKRWIFLKLIIKLVYSNNFLLITLLAGEILKIFVFCLWSSIYASTIFVLERRLLMDEFSRCFGKFNWAKFNGFFFVIMNYTFLIVKDLKSSILRLAIYSSSIQL